MNVRITSIFTQKIGVKRYFWGQDDENQIFLLNNYPELSEIINLEFIKQNPYNLFQSIPLHVNKEISIPRTKLSRLLSTSYHIH